MSARTCQLCGKVLSRLRVGGDGDFCSREHRNQSRLRAGMDRLEDANKVASLMRRRENPRHISPARLMRNPAALPREYPQVRLAIPNTEPRPFSPSFGALAQPRMPVLPDNCKQPPASRLPGISALRGPDCSLIRITGRGVTPLFPRRKAIMTTALDQARIRQLHWHGRAAALESRQFGLLRQTGTRVHLGKGPAVLRRIASPGAAGLQTGVRTYTMKASPKEGKALRVSIALGFRHVALRLRNHQTSPVMSSDLPRPTILHPIFSHSIDHQSPPQTFSLKLTMPAVSWPTAPAPKRSARFDFPDALPPTSRSANQGEQPASRTSGVFWIPADPRWRGATPQAWKGGFATRNGAHLFALQMAPAGTNSQPQAAVSPFLPQDVVGYPKITFQCVAGGAILTPGTSASQPEPEPEAQPVICLEDHFDAGWNNWAGGVQDWLLDVAGVRTGSLALFVPTLELEDYELEFLTRIDHHSVTWVIRAAGPDDYFRCTLTAQPGGELEFTRCMVTGGVAQSGVRAAQRHAARPRAAMTVRTEVSGDTFAVSIGGKTIDTWTDDRLPIGGIGFIGTPDDRARLYWVRLSFRGSPGKEY
jgi:hypothetical protein